MIKLNVVVSIATILCLPACMHGSANVSPNTVLKKASSDLECPASDVKVENVTGSNWNATGCGKKITYMCSGSNSMSEGSCMRDGS